MTITDKTKEEECCCTCIHNIRTGKPANIQCYCDIDGHYIGYVACFDNVCELWENKEK